jgi:hypothetical protein
MSNPKGIIMNRILLPLFTLIICAFVGTAQGATRKPNVVVLLVDDMGYGDPGCYNTNSKISTPSIDRFPREGVRFTDAHAPGPLCHSSRYGQLTGRYPFRTDVSMAEETAYRGRADDYCIAAQVARLSHRKDIFGRNRVPVKVPVNEYLMSYSSVLWLWFRRSAES